MNEAKTPLVIIQPLLNTVKGKLGGEALKQNGKQNTKQSRKVGLGCNCTLSSGKSEAGGRLRWIPKAENTTIRGARWKIGKLRLTNTAKETEKKYGGGALATAGEGV